MITRMVPNISSLILVVIRSVVYLQSFNFLLLHYLLLCLYQFILCKHLIHSKFFSLSWFHISRNTYIFPGQSSHFAKFSSLQHTYLKYFKFGMQWKAAWQNYYFHDLQLPWLDDSVLILFSVSFKFTLNLPCSIHKTTTNHRKTVLDHHGRCNK